MKHYWILLAFAALVFTACGEHNCSDENGMEEASMEVEFKGVKASMEVGEMGCMICVGKVTDALKELDGVANIKVSLEDENAEFDYDPKKISLDEIAKVITDLDYVVGAYSEIED